MTSGYTSNTTMTLDSEALKQTLELTAELIKDLRQDHVPPGGGEKLAWFQTAITMPDKGMIFPEPIKGAGKDEWMWTVVKAIPIPEDEQHKYPDPTNPGTFYKNKMDMKNLKRFDKMTKKLSLLLPKVEAAPQVQQLKLPKLKKAGPKQELPKLKLPKLKKIEI